MPKPTTVYGIVSFGGHLVRGMVRVVLTTEEPMTVLESDKLYYGESVKARVTKTKVLTMSELTEKLEEEFNSHKTDVQHMYKLNSSESVKILKKVFDVKTCKKLSFSKDSEDESEDDVDSIASVKGKEEPATKGIKVKEEPATKSTKVKEEPATKSTKAKEEPVAKSTKGKSTAVKEEVITDKKKPDLTDSKKTTTSKVKDSKVRIPLSDSEDDVCSDLDCDV